MKSKSPTVLLLSLLVVLISTAFTKDTFPATANAASDPVVDIKGNPIKVGVPYYIVSIIIGAGGGGLNYKTVRTANNSCSLNVYQESSDINFGTPMTFSPENQNEDVIRESTDLNIKFASSPLNCDQSPVWKLSGPDWSGRYFVTGGGSVGNPGCKTYRNWFKIKKEGVAKPITYYKLMICPMVCDFVFEPICGKLGIYYDDESWRLKLNANNSDKVFQVAFIEAKKKSSSSSSSI